MGLVLVALFFFLKPEVSGMKVACARRPMTIADTSAVQTPAIPN
jgi:hypothetical protein